MIRSRRDFLATMTMAGGAAAFALPAFAAAQHRRRASMDDTEPAMHARDWAWLVGNWDVWHRRLRERLVGSTEWEEFPGKSALWLAMGGLGTIDDNIVDLPGGTYHGLTLRTFDPVSRNWSIWWLDSRSPVTIDPPVVGGFDGDTGTFLGQDTLNGRPVTVRFRWQDIHGPRPWWEQAFSADGGMTWEVNWRNYFTRTAATPTPLPLTGRAPDDWGFLVGGWEVRHRRLRHRLVGSSEWDEFAGTLTNWPVLGGQGNVGDNVMAFPSGTVRGVGLRAFDADTRQWISWWVDSRNPATLAPPVHGGFEGGVGTFMGDDTVDGRPVKTRVLWSRITPRSAHWEQACSADGGATWEINWISDFTRTA